MYISPSMLLRVLTEMGFCLYKQNIAYRWIVGTGKRLKACAAFPLLYYELLSIAY